MGASQKRHDSSYLQLDMNNLFTSLCKGLAAIALVGAASSAFATPVTLNVGPFGDQGGYGGGEFTAVGSGLSTVSYSSTTSSGGSFETFCMAYDEEFVPGNWGGPAYNYFLSNSTYSNSTGLPYSTLTQGTAWLYSQFAAGTLAGYDYSNSTLAGRANSAFELQEAIWMLQGQQAVGAPAAPSGDPFLTLVNSTLGANANAAASPGFDGVQIMVLNGVEGDGTTPYSQPQLYYNVPDNGTTALLVGGALFALLGFKRRFKNV
jgi:VPDSG-CTERM motif